MPRTLTAPDQLLTAIATVEQTALNDSAQETNTEALDNLIRLAATILADHPESGDTVARVRECTDGEFTLVSEPVKSYQAYGAPYGIVVNHDTGDVSIASLVGAENAVAAVTVPTTQMIADSLEDYQSGKTRTPGHLEFAWALTKQCVLTLGGSGE